MAQFLLADAVANEEMNQAEVVFHIGLLVLLVGSFFILTVWLIRRVRLSHNNIKHALEQNEESLKLLSRSCELSEASERHLEGIESNLDQVIEQLKRRPLS